MLKYILQGIIIVAVLGVLAFSFVPSKYDSWLSRTRDMIFGATDFPTSLDSFTNPNPTDSVAVVSHSSQHSNANDAIEAIEAKLGISASTPISNSVLVGNGTGSSLWSTFATTSFLYTGNLISTGSSTVIGDFTLTGDLAVGGNATMLEATTTNLAATVAATTSALYGAGLTTCNTLNKLTWSGGQFGCETDNTGSLTFVATSTATTTTAYDNKLFATVEMDAGDQITAWTSFAGSTSDGSACDRTFGLSIKVASGYSSSTMAIIPCTGLGSSEVALSGMGTYIAPSTDTYEIFVSFSPLTTGGYYNEIGFGNIIYLIQTP